MIKWAVIGECMLELRHETESKLVMGFSGDTFNVAVYLKRCTEDPLVSVDYASAIGADPYSDAMLAYFQQENIGTQYLTRLQKHLPGLYFIRTDDKGERTFYYYRSQAAARYMFSDSTSLAALQTLVHHDWLYFSGITLAILDDSSRTQLFNLLKAAKQQGARIAFDTNYRPRQWNNIEEARNVITRFLTLVDVALPTFSDETLLFGDATPETTIKRLNTLGVEEIVIKCGGDPCVLAFDNQIEQVSPEVVPHIVDTTAAGDSFNGAYLAARLAQQSPVEAARAGHALAAKVIGYPGAILPK